MESDFTPQEALAEAERGAAAVWVDHSPKPWWYFAGVGAWTAALALAMTELQGSWFVLALLALVAVEVIAVLLYSRKRGAWPNLADPPAEFRPAIRVFLAGAAALVVVVVLLAVFAGSIAAAVAAFAGAAGGVLWYEKACERAAARLLRRIEGTG